MKNFAFSKYVKEYDKASWPQLEMGKNLIKKFDLKDKTVLEIGCHAGKLSTIIAQEAKKVVGVDLASDAIKVAKERAKKEGLKNTKFHIRNAEKMDLKEKFDIIISNIAFHVFRDKPGSLKVMKKHLKKGGKIGLTFPIEGVKNEEEFRKIYFSIMNKKPYSDYESEIKFEAPKGFKPKEHVRKMFENAGLKNIEIKERHPTFWFKDEKDFIEHYEGSSPRKEYLKHLPKHLRSKARKEILGELKKHVTDKGLKMTWGKLEVIAEK